MFWRMFFEGKISCQITMIPTFTDIFQNGLTINVAKMNEDYDERKAKEDEDDDDD